MRVSVSTGAAGRDRLRLSMWQIKAQRDICRGTGGDDSQGGNKELVIVVLTSTTGCPPFTMILIVLIVQATFPFLAFEQAPILSKAWNSSANRGVLEVCIKVVSLMVLSCSISNKSCRVRLAIRCSLGMNTQIGRPYAFHTSKTALEIHIEYRIEICTFIPLQKDMVWNRR